MKKDAKYLAREIALKAGSLGGSVYYVGGHVRDEFLGIESKDIDIEVHGLEIDQLKEILKEYGQVDLVGESFGIFMVKGFDLDISMPRIEEAKGRGHRDFDVSVNPHLGTFKAARRRDFTINSIMKNVLNGEIVDHYGGINDIEKGILRCVDEKTFGDDPLRVLRAARFAAKLDFQIEERTLDICSKVKLDSLSRERVFDEVKRALVQSKKPSIFFQYMREMNQLGFWFKELEDLIGVVQPLEHHKEGDVWNHTMLVLDEAGKYKDGIVYGPKSTFLKSENPFYFMMSALCHDMGKAITTEEINGKIHALGHEEAGVDIAMKFVGKMTGERELKKYVKNMILLHMKPNMFAAQGSKVKSTNKLFYMSQDPKGLMLLAMADHFGRIDPGEYTQREEFLGERLEIFEHMMSLPYVTGEDLINAGLVPGENFKDILEYSQKLRMAQIDKDQALKQTLAYARGLK